MDEIAMDTLELILHPVRVRIIHAMSGGRIRTTSDLCARLADVSKATVYRHVTLLTQEGVLEVAGEERVHGAMERHYRLSPARPLIDTALATSMTLEDHRRGFVAAMAALMAEFNRYLDGDNPDPVADSVGYRQIPLWLTPEEVAGLVKRLGLYVKEMAANQPGPLRRPYLLSPIFFPLEASAAFSGSGQAEPDIRPAAKT